MQPTYSCSKPTHTASSLTERLYVKAPILSQLLDDVAVLGRLIEKVEKERLEPCSQLETTDGSSRFPIQFQATKLSPLQQTS